VKIRNPETDVVLKLQRIIRDFSMQFSLKKDTLTKEKKIDTQSYVFYKNLRELNIYKEKFQGVQKDLFLATLFFRKEKIKYLSIKKKLIIQNIQLIEKRIKNTQFSYTSIVK
jgi:hypothetical protein